MKQSLKTQEKLKELELLYQNAIYRCISYIGLKSNSFTNDSLFNNQACCT